MFRVMKPGLPGTRGTAKFGNRLFTNPPRKPGPPIMKKGPGSADPGSTSSPGSGGTTPSGTSPTGKVGGLVSDLRRLVTTEVEHGVGSQFGIGTRVVRTFRDVIPWMETVGIGADSVLKLTTLLDDPDKARQFMQTMWDMAAALSNEGQCIRTDEETGHQYGIITPTHRLSPRANRILADASAEEIISWLAQCFPAGGTFGKVVTLGKSGVVVPSKFQKTVIGDLRMTRCVMTTGPWHALDGLLKWMLLHNFSKEQFCYTAFGGGVHRNPMVDRLNPVLGTAMMSAMTSVLELALNKGFVLAGKSPEEVRDFVRKENPALARRIELLALADLMAVPIAWDRQEHGGNTVAVIPTDTPGTGDSTSK